MQRCKPRAESSTDDQGAGLEARQGAIGIAAGKPLSEAHFSELVKPSLDHVSAFNYTSKKRAGRVWTH